jgi:hypothetical protein
MPMRGTHAFCAAVFVALAPLRAASDAQGQRPVPLENGHIQQGPYLVLSQGTPGLQVMRGTQIIIHDAGIYGQGKAGYYPFGRMPKKELDLGPGTITFHGGIPKAGVSYDQEVSIQGNRIRIRFRRNGRWQGGHWESFFFELPFENYRAVRIRADRRVVRLPEAYSEAKRRVVSRARRIECNLDDPSLNLVLECDRGMSVSDRRRWSSLKYLVAVPISDRSGKFTDLYLTLPRMRERDTWAVRYSPIGYPARGEKKVVLEWPKHLKRPGDDRVRLRRAGGKRVKKGRFGETVTLRHMQGAFAMFDFSDVTEPGDYRIDWARGSVKFPIRRSAFEDRLWQPTLDCMIPFQMCHAEVDLGPGLPGHSFCHMDDGIRVPAGFAGTDGFRAYECTGTPYGAGDPIPCAKGGWHDAGDCDLNIYAQGFSTLVLALAYEEFALDRDVATVDVAAGRFRLGKPDGTPDILQQVEWGTLWLLSMMQPDGRSYVGVVAQPSRRGRGGGWDKSTDNRPGTGDERHVYVDHHSELQLMQAQTLCAAHRVLKRHRVELARTCLEAARKAYDHFRTHAEVYRPTAYFYDKHVGSRDHGVVSALAELYMTTADPGYLRELEAMADEIARLSVSYPDKRESGVSSFWFAGPSLARLIPRLEDGGLKQACLSTCRRAARHQAELLGRRPWAGHYTDFGKLGSAHCWPTRVYDVYWMSKVVPDVVSLDKAVMPMLWLYGFHPFSDVSYYAAEGLDGPEHIHCGHLTHLFKPERGTLPGALVPGMTAVRPYVPDNVLYYFDDGNVANTEYTIAGLTRYLFAVPALQKAGY